MNDYKQYQEAQSTYEKAANEKHEGIGLLVHWLFLVAGAAVSAGASFFIGHRGLAGNAFYDRFIGAQNAAFLVVFLLDGTFLALNLGLASFLKSEKQRLFARTALVIVKLILCVNILAAFLMVQSAAAVPIISQYVTYGSPLVVGGVIWLWSELFSNRRKNQMMAAALDVQAQRDSIWAKQYITDQHRNRQAYEIAASSPQMAALRQEVARRKAIEDIAAQFNLPFEQAEQIYLHAEAERASKAARLLDSARRGELQGGPGAPPSKPNLIN